MIKVIQTISKDDLAKAAIVLIRIDSPNWVSEGQLNDLHETLVRCGMDPEAYILVLCGKETSIEAVDEDTMARTGWVRAPKGSS